MDQPPTQRVAANIRATLARQQMRGRELSRRMGWPSTTGQRRLSGQYPINVEELAAVAAILEVPIAVLLDGVEAPAESETGRSA